MRSAELTAFLLLAVGLVAVWLGWLVWMAMPLWIPTGLSLIALMLFVARIVLLSVRQD